MRTLLASTDGQGRAEMVAVSPQVAVVAPATN
jgi:hypothetical protein